MGRNVMCKSCLHSDWNQLSRKRHIWDHQRNIILDWELENINFFKFSYIKNDIANE